MKQHPASGFFCKEDAAKQPTKFYDMRKQMHRRIRTSKSKKGIKIKFTVGNRKHAEYELSLEHLWHVVH